MANLEIKGHATRGKEVIDILEMLGGENVYQYEGYNVCSCLFIDEVTNAIHSELLATIYLKRNVKRHILTLEEFLEKFPYKVGDFVRVPEYDSKVCICKMRWNSLYNYMEYLVNRDDTPEWYTAKALLDYNEPNNEETMKETNKAIFEGNAQCCNIMNNIIKDNIEEAEEGVYAYNEINCYHQDFGDKVRIRLGGDFEIKVEDKLTYIVRKKPQYPKTYEECCKILGIDTQFCMKYLPHGTLSYKDILIYNLQELLICRDAYWKIAGEQMKLGKPWEPTMETVYCISRSDNVIKCSYRGGKSNVLEFPTEETRDAFYENFKDLIENCKELL